MAVGRRVRIGVDETEANHSSITRDDDDECRDDDGHDGHDGHDGREGGMSSSPSPSPSILLKNVLAPKTMTMTIMTIIINRSDVPEPLRIVSGKILPRAS